MSQRARSRIFHPLLPSPYSLLPAVMKISVQLEAAPDLAAPEVEYTWDADTEILSAHLKPQTKASGMSGSVGLEGSDGSWVILDVASGCINGVEIAVWPDVRNLAVLTPPANVGAVRATVPSRQSQPVIASLEMATRLVAEADT